MSKKNMKCDFCDKIPDFSLVYTNLHGEKHKPIWGCNDHKSEAQHKYNCLYGTSFANVIHDNNN